MLLSTRYGFAFLCMPKCASTSIESVIAEYCNVAVRGNTKLRHINAQLYRKYIKALHEDVMPERAIESFCLMREPMEWLHSWYRYRTRDALKNPRHPNHANYTGEMSFSDFVEAYLSDDRPEYANVESQADFVLLASGEIGVDRIFPIQALGRVEAYLSDKMKRDIVIPRKNVSPEIPFELPGSLKKEAIECLSKDYELYHGVLEESV